MPIFLILALGGVIYTAAASKERSKSNANGVGYEDETDCCHGCHFDFEEDEAFRYLPPLVARYLKQEHDWLRREGFPHHATKIHAAREMKYYHRFVPPDIVRQIEADHAKLLTR